ncbi:MAG: CoA transferase [Myxococcota bacterium]|jgi:crotonobetainyl-CoA:carnitine CoA-transferase CaiB-like acyl-CoA transferase|nr:CoA transferase [Myxococcota bacterium]
MTGPLAGVKVVDCAAYITGPFAAMLLGDQGADVVKVEPIGFGDMLRHLGTGRGGMSTVFSGTNRSKRSIALNLREEAGRDILFELIADTDVFIQNFRPGVVQRLGIDEATLREIKPDLVYVSISAFGQEGPWASKPAFDHVLQGATGFAHIQTNKETGEPGFVLHTVVDKLTALTVSQAVTAALFHRANTGEGQHIELSMLGAALQFLWPDGMVSESLLGEGGDHHPPLSASYRFVTVKDGHVVIAALTPDQIHGVMRAVGHPEFIEDPRFSTVQALLENLDEFQAATTAAALKLTVAECVAAFEREDVPCAPVMSPAEIIEHPQTEAQRFISEVEHPVMGHIRQTRPPATFSRSAVQVERLAPGLGADTREILGELGRDEEAVNDLAAKGIIGLPS